MVEAIKIYEDDTQDANVKGELEKLTKSIDITDSNFGEIDKLFDKINDLREGQQQKALGYALRECDIKVGNSTKKLSDIAQLFEDNVEQDGTSWKIKLKDGVNLGDAEKNLVESFLNERQSPLAYLIQKSAQEIKLQAEKGYGAQASDKLNIGVDKVFGNQTRRALEGLKDWIGSDLNNSVDTIDITSLNVNNILEMKFISKELKEKIENSENSGIKDLWENEDYTYLRPYTNNYALKIKNETGGVDVIDSKKQEIINKHELIDVDLSENSKVYYGIPSDVDVYKKPETHGYYFFDKGTLTYMPDLSYSGQIPVKQQYVEESNSWYQEVLGCTKNLSEHIISSIKSSAKKYNITHNVIYTDSSTEENIFYLRSHNQTKPIDFPILAGSGIVSGTTKDAFGKNLLLLDLANKIHNSVKDKKITSSSYFEWGGHGAKTLLIQGVNGFEWQNAYALKRSEANKYAFLMEDNNKQAFVDYLNKNIIPNA